VLSAHIRRSSGHESLDRETLALLKRAEPLPVPPESIEGNVITLTVPISYGLEDQG
jgi:protein TonB